MERYDDAQTNKILKNLEKKIAEEYKEAYKEIEEYASSYFETLTERYDAEYEKYLAGAYTESEFKAWYQTQVARGRGYEVMRDELASRMVNSNQVASAYINDVTPSIYSLNANYSAYEVSQAYRGVSFQLYDEQTVRNLIMEGNQVEFKTTKVNPIRDYEWNKKQITKALTSGIMQGKDIGQIADSFYNVMERNKTSAIRNARTSVTSAQNSGRQDTYNRASKMGITIYKEWIATLDSRTRDSHADLDGEVIKNDDVFSNGLEYPADPMGAPEEVYNCRCTMRAILPDINDEGRQTYREWELGVNYKADNENYKAPEVKGKIDFNNSRAVDSLFDEFENDNIDSDEEIACVVLNNGDIYYCYGTKNSVYPDKDLGELLVGAKVSHIHPVEVTEYSFSSSDIELFDKYKLVELRGADVKYSYILDRTGVVDDRKPLCDIGFEDIAHENAITSALEYGYGYRRKLND